MFSGSESPEAIDAMHHERLRQIERTAREIEVMRLLAQPSNPGDPEARRRPLRQALAFLAAKFRPGSRMQQLPGS